MLYETYKHQYVRMTVFRIKSLLPYRQLEINAHVQTYLNQNSVNFYLK